ncbi:hypothetical protein EKO27_g5499 [Xylaria grammica]|uniref:Uncharacterized protein n=1 Tax=Xylaria grammica TaxID=363999 RepID=A0A439D5B1_9PEZI|nr:hypothetical protein EKO27_g5499 [Xylaria grammica]
MLTKRSAPLYWLLSIAASSAVGNEAGGQRITPTPILQARGAFQTAGFISANPVAGNRPLVRQTASQVAAQIAFTPRLHDGKRCYLSFTDIWLLTGVCVCPFSTDAASPSCAEYVLRTAADDENPFTSFLCLPAATQILVFVDPTADNGAGSSAVGSSGGSRGTSISTQAHCRPTLRNPLLIMATVAMGAGAA